MIRAKWHNLALIQKILHMLQNSCKNFKFSEKILTESVSAPDSLLAQGDEMGKNVYFTAFGEIMTDEVAVGDMPMRR